MSYIINNNATFSDLSRPYLLSDCNQHVIPLKAVHADWENALPQDHLSLTAIRKHYGGGLSKQAVEQALEMCGVEIKTTFFLTPEEPHAYDAFWQVLTGPLADNAEVQVAGASTASLPHWMTVLTCTTRNRRKTTFTLPALIPSRSDTPISTKQEKRWPGSSYR